MGGTASKLKTAIMPSMTNQQFNAYSKNCNNIRNIISVSTNDVVLKQIFELIKKLNDTQITELCSNYDNKITRGNITNAFHDYFSENANDVQIWSNSNNTPDVIASKYKILTKILQSIPTEGQSQQQAQQQTR